MRKNVCHIAQFECISISGTISYRFQMGNATTEIACDPIETVFAARWGRLQSHRLRTKHSSKQLCARSPALHIRFFSFHSFRFPQATTVPAYLYPVVLRMATAALPEGVSLTVLPHGKYLDTVRYVPDNDLRDLKMELEDVGSDKKKKKKFVPKKI